DSGRQGDREYPVKQDRCRERSAIHVVEVNRDFYMTITTIDSERYTQTTRTVEALIEQYSLPYLIRPNPRDVLVVGAGGGVDVEAALIHGAERVDAVEIDPVIIQL